MKLFNVPFTHPYIQNLTEFDILLLNESVKLDDPEYFSKVKNMVVDTEFDEYANEVESDELTAEEQAMMEKIINGSNSTDTTQNSDVADFSDDFDDMSNDSNTQDVNDWEEV